MAKIIDDFPHEIREIEYELIPLSDGTNLAIRYWLPIDAIENPVPAILEYIPYCTRDGTAARDEAMHPYFAGHGYAAIRVDLRGSGESEGVMLGEYLLQEQDDALEVIDWISKQPWCDGNVGMMGKSWGGFNGLQVAALKPAALKCIISVFSTDDRYSDDVHYNGGCLLTNNAGWSFAMFPAGARPADPLLVGEGWRDMWFERMEATYPWVLEWIKHQRRDEFWKHGSVCESYDDIECPVYAIGGWADPYSNTVPRLLANLKNAPSKGLVGPWGHQYAHQATPAPEIGYLQESLRWWDYWLKGIDTGIMDEPQYRVWEQDSQPPMANYHARPGRWIAEPSWPSEAIKPTNYFLNSTGLGSIRDMDNHVLKVCSPQDTGKCTLTWGHMGAGDAESPLDQRPDDAMSLCFDTEPLKEGFSILGAPTVTLDVSADRPNAFVCIRLDEVSPDGASTQITHGLLNLTHRNSHEHIEPVVVGERYQVKVVMNDIAHAFTAGNKIRVAVSSTNFPVFWPSPETVELSVFTGNSVLELPIREASKIDKQLTDFSPAEQSRVHDRTVLRPSAPAELKLDHNVVTDVHRFIHIEDAGKVMINDHGWTFGRRVERRNSITPNDPNSMKTEYFDTSEFSREGSLDIRIETNQTMTSDKDRFKIEAHLEAFENGTSVFERTWSEYIDRDGI
jgi:putative CocE/NonD family hydrolase